MSKPILSTVALVAPISIITQLSRRRLFLTLTLLGLLAVLSIGVLEPAQPAAAAQISGSPTPVTPPTPSMDDLMAQAQNTLNQAQAASAQASQVSSQAGVVLNFIQVVSIVGTVLAALAGIIITGLGIRTLNEYQGDLGKARLELDKMQKDLAKATSDAAQTRADLQAYNSQQIQALRNQATDTYRALSLLQLGEQQFDAGNIPAALQMYQEAYQLNPESQVVNYLLGELYLIERELPHAIEYLERALQLGPSMAPAYAALGLAKRLQADRLTDLITRNQGYAAAEQLLLKAVEMNPGSRDVNKESVFATLGGLYRRQERLQDAIQAYEQAEKFTPNNSYPLINLGQLQYLRDDVDNAKKHFSTALDATRIALMLKPHDNWVRLDAITAKLGIGQTQEALQELAALLPQIRNVGQMETALSGFRTLQKAPHPPPGIDQAIQMVEAALKNRSSTTTVSPAS